MLLYFIAIALLLFIEDKENETKPLKQFIDEDLPQIFLN